VRKCPACKTRLPLLTITDPTGVLTFLCPRCWATVRLNPVEFATYTIAGALVGIAIGIVLFAVKRAAWEGVELLFYLSVAGGWIGGRLFPRLEVEDPPIAES
jgi:hypothetical protein